MFAAGVYTFAENADFAPGGITGISLLLNHVFGIPVGTLTLFINLPLIVISYRTLGKRFLLKTAKSMVITTFFLDVVFPVFPMYEGQRMMAALCSGALLCSICGALLREVLILSSCRSRKNVLIYLSGKLR